MASYDNLITMEQWGFRSTFNDSWFPDLFAKETETLTKVLQKSYNSDVMPTVEMTSPTFFQTPSASGPTVSGGSENETAVSKRRSNGGGGGGGGGGVSNKKIVKRKPRASKRPSTTYITADVDSFRQMVQQVTGVSNGHVAVCSILKPEPRRPVDLVQPVCCLPTLDTSAFLLDPTSSFMQPPLAAAGCVAVSHLPSPVVVDGGYGFDYFSGFPTLESGI